MAFHKSSKDVKVVDGYLIASCTDCAGRDQNSQLHLDQYLGNSNGFFEWGGGGFSRSADDISISHDGDSLYLYARLRTQHKSWRDARVNLSDRITNSNGVLEYIGGREPHIEYSRGFLGEERDFLSAAISDTISDLRELFTGDSLFDAPTSRSSRRERFIPREHPESPRPRGSVPTEDSNANPSHSNMADSTTSIRTSKADLMEEPPAYNSEADLIDMQPSHDPEQRKDKESSQTIETKLPSEKAVAQDMTSQQVSSHDQEDLALQQVKDFLLSGNGNTVRSFKSQDGKRSFELRGEDGTVRTLHIEDRTLFDQDRYRRGSVSEASGCMTPSIVDGEEEYDFLE